jgi:hypothetical protein
VAVRGVIAKSEPGNNLATVLRARLRQGEERLAELVGNP